MFCLPSRCMLYDETVCASRRLACLLVLLFGVTPLNVYDAYDAATATLDAFPQQARLSQADRLDAAAGPNKRG
jgi:hypothetical protein